MSPLLNEQGQVCTNEPETAVFPWAFGLYESKTGSSKPALSTFQTYGFEDNYRVHIPIAMKRFASTRRAVLRLESPPIINPAAKPTGDVAITHVAFGNGSDGKSEYVEIRNDDAYAIQLVDWRLSNQAGDVFTFPYLELQPNQTCRIYTQGFYKQWCGLMIGSDNSVWSNLGDSVSIVDASNSPVTACSYLGSKTHKEKCPIKVVIGEVGKLDTLTHQETVIKLNHSFVNPVVFIMPPSRNGHDVSIVRITNVQRNQFTAHIDEAPNHGVGAHGVETVSYIVLEAGQWTLPDGSQMLVGEIETNATVGNRIRNQWAQVEFDNHFDESPIVLSQVQSYQDKNWVKTRQRNISQTGFSVALEGASSKRTTHNNETIGWMAINPSQFDWDGVFFTAGRTSNAVTHRWFTLSFNQPFDAPPRFIGSLSSYDGSDNAHLRFDLPSLTVNGIRIMVEEDTTHDREQGHTSETVDYIIIEQDSLLVVSP